MPISTLSSEEIYALLDNICSDDEEAIDNLMNDSDTEIVDRTALENVESDNLAAVMHEKDNSNISNFILTTKPTEALVQIAKPDYESVDDGDLPLSNLGEKRCHLEALVQIAKPDYESVDDGDLPLSNLGEKRCHLEIK